MLRIIEGQLAKVERGELRYAISLAAIERIIAFKRDMLTTDLVCLEIDYVEADGTAMHVEINEEIPGFDEVMSYMEREMGGIDREWRAKVINAPLAKNETVIFGHE